MSALGAAKGTPFIAPSVDGAPPPPGFLTADNAIVTADTTMYTADNYGP